MSNEKKKIYEVNEITVDALQRFLYSKNPISYFTNIVLNSLWYIGKLIKKILKKDKIENPIVKETETIFLNNVDFTIDDLIVYKDALSNNKETIVFIDLLKENKDTSGALDYGTTKINEYIGQGYQVFLLAHLRNSDKWCLYLNESNKQRIAINQLIELKTIFGCLNIKKVIISNLAYLNNPEEFIDDFTKLIKTKNFNIEMVFHDHLSVCPSLFLLNKEGKPCTIENNVKCNECLYNNKYRIVVRNDISLWRSSFSKLFACIDNFVFFSKYTKDKICSVYPEIETRSEVKPHKVLLSDKSSKYVKPKSKDGIIRIGFVGYFCHLKGSDYFIDVINKFIENEYNVEPVIIGEIDKEVNVNYRSTGKYNRDDLGRILTENKVDFVIFPSANNETFSYVCEELIFLNVPFVLFACGAPKERIIKQKYDLALVCEEVNSETLYKKALELIEKLNIK